MSKSVTIGGASPCSDLCSCVSVKVAILVESSKRPREPSLVDPYLALVGVIFGSFATLDRRSQILC